MPNTVRKKDKKMPEEEIGIRTKFERTCPLFWRKGGQNNTCCTDFIISYDKTVYQKMPYSCVGHVLTKM